MSKPPHRISDLDKPDPNCKTCSGEGWVCEQHPELFAFHDDCAGPGMPCKCSPLHRDNWDEETKAHHKWCDEQNERMNKGKR